MTWTPISSPTRRAAAAPASVAAFTEPTSPRMSAVTSPASTFCQLTSTTFAVLSIASAASIMPTRPRVSIMPSASPIVCFVVAPRPAILPPLRAPQLGDVREMMVRVPGVAAAGAQSSVSCAPISGCTKARSNSVDGHARDRRPPSARERRRCRPSETSTGSCHVGEQRPGVLVARLDRRRFFRQRELDAE